jgi:hypothetical protein
MAVSCSHCRNFPSVLPHHFRLPLPPPLLQTYDPLLGDLVRILPEPGVMDILAEVVHNQGG